MSGHAHRPPPLQRLLRRLRTAVQGDGPDHRLCIARHRLRRSGQEPEIQRTGLPRNLLRDVPRMDSAAGCCQLPGLLGGLLHRAALHHRPGSRLARRLAGSRLHAGPVPCQDLRGQVHGQGSSRLYEPPVAQRRRTLRKRIQIGFANAI